MEDGSVVLETFQSEIVTESDEDVNNDDDQTHLLPSNGEGRRKIYKERDHVRTRVVYNILQTGTSSGASCCSCSRKSIFCILVALIVTGVVFFLLTQNEAILENIGYGTKPNLDYMDFKQPDNMVSYQEILEDSFSFNISDKKDVMVFLHIQKTGGTTFGKHLVEDIDLARPCDCHRKNKKLRIKKFHCDCFRPGTQDSNWLFSRYSTGWKCGLHPDWTELTGCVDNFMSETETRVLNRRYFYITFLRDPVDRYLSEWRHVYRGATWRDATLTCGGQVWGDILPKCYGENEDWRGVSLKDFMSCPDNLASNRQTRMLADLNLVNCYNMTNINSTKRNQILLNSAKANLVNMAYFGLTEEQEKSQYLFEETFNLRFKTDFDQLNKIDTHSGHSQNKLSEEEIASVRNLNKLDIELYKFAKRLLIRRFDNMKDNDDSFQEHLEEVEHEKEFSWEDIENENYDDETAVTSGPKRK